MSDEVKPQDPPPSYNASLNGGKYDCDADIVQKLSSIADEVPMLIDNVKESMIGVAKSYDALRKDLAPSIEACKPSVSTLTNFFRF